jgi:hypothetical protein
MTHKQEQLDIDENNLYFGLCFSEMGMGRLHNIIYIKETVLTLLEEAIRDNISNSKVKSIFISSKLEKTEGFMV